MLKENGINATNITSSDKEYKNYANNVMNIKSNLDNTKVGNYTITYTSTYNGVTKELTRIVHVLDNIASNYVSGLYQYRDDENGLIKDNTEDETEY